MNTQTVHIHSVQAANERLRREAARLKASLAAIHWAASRSDIDQAVIASIRSECEFVIPELKHVLANVPQRITNHYTAP